MRYEKIYNLIIERAKGRIIEGYVEKHHIIPKCLGGNDSKDNIVKLTFKEHFICHRLLCKMYPENEKIIYAFSSMVRASWKNEKRFAILTGKHFEIVKKTIAPYTGKWNKGKTPWNKGLKGEEYKKYYSENSLKPPSHKGTMYINDGVNQKKILKTENIPEGWVKGCLSLMGDNNPMKNKEVAKKNVQNRKTNKEGLV